MLFLLYSSYLLNRITFVHVAFSLDLSEPLMLLENITASLNQSFYKELVKARHQVKEIKTEEDVLSIWGDGSFQDLYHARSLDDATVCLILLEMFMRLKSQLHNLLVAVPENYGLDNSQLIHQLTKRAAMNFLPHDTSMGTNYHNIDINDFWPKVEDKDLANLTSSSFLNRDKRDVLGGLALGVSLWNSYRLDQLEDSLRNLSAKYNQLVDATNLLSAKHSQLAMDVVLMKRLVEIIVHSNYRKVLANSISSSDQIRDTIENVVSIITSGRQRRVSPRLINGDALAEIFLALTRKAKDLDCELILDHPTDLYDVQASYGYSKQGLEFKIYAHVPMASRSQTLALFEHLPFPFSHQSIMANASITPSTGVDKFLAVLPMSQSSSSMADHRFRILSEVELNSCFKLRDYFLCSNRNVLRLKLSHSCIGSLWLKEKDLISRNCDLKIEPLHEAVVKTAPKEWLVFSPYPASFTVKCGTKTVESLRFEYQTRLSLVEDCELTLKDHYLSTDSNAMLNFKVKTYEWRYFGSLFEGSPEDINAFIDDISATKNKFGVKDLSHLRHYVEVSSGLLSGIMKSISNLKIFSWFGNIYSFLLYVAIAWLCYLAISRGWFKKCLFRRKRTQDTLIARPLRTPIIRYRSVKAPSNDLEQPPPYASIEMNSPSAPAMDESSSVTYHSEVASDSCLVKHKNKNQKMSDFICHSHDPVNGCSGSFGQKVKSK